MKIKDISIDERPREKLIKYGYDDLTDSELLAIIIGIGTKNVNAMDLSKLILETFSNKELLDIAAQELTEIKGIGIGKASKIIASIQFGKRLAKKIKTEEHKHITNSEDVYDFLSYKYENETREFFSVILLSTNNDIISTEIISIGDLSSSIVNPREVFKPAIKKSAKNIILMHNHPSGNPTPSRNDYLITKRLVEAGKILDIRVLDHIIFGLGCYYSFKDENKLTEL